MKKNTENNEKNPVNRGAEGFHKWASGARKPTKEEKERAKQYSAAQTPFGEPDHVSHSEMEERFDRQSKENYDRIDKELMDAVEETDKRLPKDLDEYLPFKPSERKKLRELMNWQERFLVWLIRITFMLFLYAYWNVHYPKYLENQKQLQELQEKVELLNEMLHPTEAPEESNHWMLCNGTDTMLVRRQ